MQLPLLKRPEEKMVSLLKKIESGKGNEETVENFMKKLGKNPEQLREVLPVLIGCLKKQDTDTLKYSTLLLRKIAQQDIEQILEAAPLLIELLRRKPKSGEQEIRENAAILIYYLSKVYPEIVEDSITVLISCLDDLYSTVRRITYSTLLSIASERPEYLIPSIQPLTRCLGSIHQDTRAAAAHILGTLAEKHPRKLLDAYPHLKILSWYHPSSEIRMEATIALEKIESELITKEGLCPIFGAEPKEQSCNVCKQQCELSIANPDNIIAKRLIKDEEQVLKNREAIQSKDIKTEVIQKEEKKEVHPKEEKELDSLFKDIRESFSSSAEKVLENLGLAHIVHEPSEKENKKQEQIKCGNCGANLPAKAKFCIECGDKIGE